MMCVDTCCNPRIPVLMEMVGAISRATTPNEVLHHYSRGLRRLQGPRGYLSLSTRNLPPGRYRITRLIHAEDFEGLEASDPWRESGSIPVQHGGFLGEIIRQAYPEIIHHLEVKDDPVLGDALRRYQSLIAIPLFDNGEPLNWAIMLSEDPEGFSVSDLEEAILRGNLVGSTVRNVLVAQELRHAHEQIRREVEQVASIQRALLPRRVPDIPGLSLAASYQVYDQAGGDYYDFFRLDGGDQERWGFVVADATGHGPGAAVLMSMLSTLLHAMPLEPEGPGEILAHANHHLSRRQLDSSFLTAFYGIYETKTQRLRYARAGHPPPLLKDPGPGGAVRRLDDAGSLPLGIEPDLKYDEAEITLKLGQTLVMYTDGITEAMSPSRRMFGLHGIEDALTQCSGEVECVQPSIMLAVREHEGGTRPSDDQTLLALQRVE